MKIGSKVKIYHEGRMRDGIVKKLATKKTKRWGTNWWWVDLSTSDCVKNRTMKPEHLIDPIQGDTKMKKNFTLRCTTCRRERIIAGDTGNPPKAYCCGREMKEKK